MPADLMGKDNDPITWQTLGAILSVIGALAYGAIRIGWIEANNEAYNWRINRLEKHMDEVRSQNADTIARVPLMERRVDRLENKIDTSH